MAGKIISVLPPRQIDFTGVASGGSMTVILKRNVNVSEWPEASMLVRVNDISVPAGNIDIIAYYEGQTQDDPALDFVAGAAGDVVLMASISAPSMQTTKLTSPLGAALRIVATGTRTGSGPLVATFGVDLKLSDYMPYNP